jgi:small GTP-binding protein
MTSLEAKIVVLGAQGVGKTSLVHRYVDSSFRPQADPPSTIGASFLTKRVLDTDTDTIVRLQIWDTAGQERFRSISRLYYRGANACILCYSITDEDSFREMGRWLTDLRKELGETVVLHVVGTKADLVAQDPGRRAVPFERCIAYVAENLYPALSSTPPATATPGGIASSESVAGVGGYRQFLASNGLALEGARSPSSKRSSGFWGQDVGWDCCHEISAETGEGVEEVFRVVTRKLVEQHRKAIESPVGTTAAGAAAGGDGERNSYFDGANTRGSFRVGRDRRSWLGFPPGVIIDEAVEQGGAVDGRKMRWKKCC